MTKSKISNTHFISLTADLTHEVVKDKFDYINDYTDYRHHKKAQNLFDKTYDLFQSIVKEYLEIEGRSK